MFSVDRFLHGSLSNPSRNQEDDGFFRSKKADPGVSLFMEGEVVLTDDQGQYSKVTPKRREFARRPDVANGSR